MTFSEAEKDRLYALAPTAVEEAIKQLEAMHSDRTSEFFQEQLELILDGLLHWLESGSIYGTENVDVGFDVSTRPVHTGKKADIASIPRLGDWLCLPTGSTHATYISGHGSAATTYQDELEEELEQHSFEWLDKLIAERHPDLFQLDGDEGVVFEEASHLIKFEASFHAGAFGDHEEIDSGFLGSIGYMSLHEAFSLLRTEALKEWRDRAPGLIDTILLERLTRAGTVLPRERI